MIPLRKKILYLSAFAIAMGFLETAVVVYLRELYYPGGFTFPLKPMPATIAFTELLREFATIIMLVGVAYISGKTKLQRFAYFCFLFAIWDVYYYVFLYLLLAWPSSFDTWDILFLLPLPWYGPVWAPCLVAITMLIGASYIINKTEKGMQPKLSKIDWTLLLAGAGVCIFSFMIEFISSLPSTIDLLQPKLLMQHAGRFVPMHFNVAIFFAGYVLMATPVLKHLLFKPQFTTHYETK